MATDDIDTHVVRHRRYYPPIPFGRRAAAFLAAVTTLAVGVPFVARLTGVESGPLALLVALMPWFTLAWVIPLLFALAARSWGLVLAVVALAGVSVYWMVPLYMSSPAGDTILTVATVNATVGQVDAEDILAMVEDHDVDVLAIEELTPALVDDLEAAGIGQRFSYSEVHPEATITGTGLWSRLPVQESREITGFESHAVLAMVDAGQESVSVLAVHPAAPGSTSHDNWSKDLARLQEVAAATDGPMILVGDFNTTRDHAAFRDLESSGFVNAAEDAGAGFLPTFPEGRLPVPIVAIDHVMARDLDWKAASAQTVILPGADHRALVVTYGLAVDD